MPGNGEAGRRGKPADGRLRRGRPACPPGGAGRRRAAARPQVSHSSARRRRTRGGSQHTGAGGGRLALESRSLGRDLSSALPAPRRSACARSASSRGEALHRPPERTAAVGLDDEGTLPGRSAGGGRLLHVRTAGQLKLLRELNEWARGGGPDLEWAENAEAEGSTTARPAAVESLRTAGCGAAAPLARPEARGEAAPPPARRFPTARLGGDGRVGEANTPAPGADGCRWSLGLLVEICLQRYRSRDAVLVRVQPPREARPCIDRPSEARPSVSTMRALSGEGQRAGVDCCM